MSSALMRDTCKALLPRALRPDEPALTSATAAVAAKASPPAPSPAPVVAPAATPLPVPLTDALPASSPAAPPQSSPGGGGPIRRRSSFLIASEAAAAASAAAAANASEDAEGPRYSLAQRRESFKRAMTIANLKHVASMRTAGGGGSSMTLLGDALAAFMGGGGSGIVQASPPAPSPLAQAASVAAAAAVAAAASAAAAVAAADSGLARLQRPVVALRADLKREDPVEFALYATRNSRLLSSMQVRAGAAPLSSCFTSHAPSPPRRLQTHVRRALCARMQWKEVSAGTVIYRQGDAADFYYVIVEG